MKKEYAGAATLRHTLKNI